MHCDWLTFLTESEYQRVRVNFPLSTYHVLMGDSAAGARSVEDPPYVSTRDAATRAMSVEDPPYVSTIDNET